MKACFFFAFSNNRPSRAPLESIETTILDSSPYSAYKELNSMMVRYPSGRGIIGKVQLRQKFRVGFHNQQRVCSVFQFMCFIYTDNLFCFLRHAFWWLVHMISRGHEIQF